MTSFVALGKCVNISRFQFPLVGKKKKKGNINTYPDYLTDVPWAANVIAFMKVL